MFFEKYKTLSRLLGKKLVYPFPKEKSGLYGFTQENEKKYVDFITGTNETGDDVTCNSNPDLLVQYLTPIYFKKEVLDKYYGQSSKYSIEHSYLRCKYLWGLQIDNHHNDKVCVWLGDLGRDLPKAGLETV